MGAVSKSLLHSTQVANALLVLLGVAFAALLANGVHAERVDLAIIAGTGAAFVMVMGATLNMVPDPTRSRATERTLSMASNTLLHLRDGLTPQNANAICALLLPETSASAIALTDCERVLAYVGDGAQLAKVGQANTAPTLEVLQSKRVETFVSMDADGSERRGIVADRRGERAYGIIVPLLVQDRPRGAIKLYYRRGMDIDRTQLAIASGLGDLLSTQLSYYELDRQAELTARAEVKALQAQINPHFLFNTLNTIAALTRTDPARARDLLREFSTFYRRTLEASESPLIPLSRELEQTKRYLVIEKARFGEDRISEAAHVERGCENLMVPSFLVQPIVENSVRHAMRDEGTLHIDVHVATDGDDILLAVADDGLGMSQEAAQRLLDDAPRPATDGKGTGMALRNVADRVERFYGKGSGVEIMSKPGEGTCVTLRLAGAARDLSGAGSGNQG